MDFKKHLFFIVLGVVILVAIGAYLVIVPAIDRDAEAKLKECESQADVLKKMAEKAEQPDAIKTRKHLDLAKEYDDKLSAQVKDMKESLVTRLKLDQRFKDVPKSASDFDIWLEKLRTTLLDQAKEANLKLSVPTDVLLFAEHTDDGASVVSRHRDYRLKHMAITQEIWDILCKK